MIRRRRNGEKSMELNPHDLSIIEDQLRECFGRIVYTHKTHEKAADLTMNRWNQIKIWQIIVSTAVTSSLVVSLFGEKMIATIISTILSAISLAINLFLKNYDLGKQAKQYSDSANKLWVIREKYLSLLIDIRIGTPDIAEIQKKRDELQDKLSKINESAPRTNKKAYDRACKSLKEMEELTFSDEEIDKFLPRQIRKTKS
ncbi:SLATT domain-containing protein [Paenibacillus larvae]|uniref:SMODS and SLOG-associating 2TM effector domain-containing protein n=1 Tax=Paenibacillus larvae subsp. larvae TaxID=147375 RepID=A0A6C0QZN0_9BACL|nr:SLATT domain-containing protein [Paenibacillus larvae]QHZ54159.1 hypothetical protein ERICV_05175 [Paenibacillus larvae subsp. larvae]